MKTKPTEKLSAILQQKCPVCGQGKVYHAGPHVYSFPQMKDDCDVCHYHFDREPGYFLGAMYASYGLAVFEGILTFLLCYFLFPALSTFAMVLCVVAVILVMSIWNYRMSRVIWMNLFPN